MIKYIIIFLFVLFSNMSCNLDLNKKRDQNRQIYMNSNDYIIEGTIKDISYLNSFYFIVSLDIDTMVINKKSDSGFYIGLINDKKKEIILYSSIDYLDRNKLMDKNLWPDKILINTNSNNITYYKKDSVFWEGIIEVDVFITTPKFWKEVSKMGLDNSWEKF